MIGKKRLSNRKKGLIDLQKNSDQLPEVVKVYLTWSIQFPVLAIFIEKLWFQIFMAMLDIGSQFYGAVFYIFTIFFLVHFIKKLKERVNRSLVFLWASIIVIYDGCWVNMMLLLLS